MRTGTYEAIVKVYKTLNSTGKNISDVAHEARITLPTASRILTLLEQLGLASHERNGREKVFYRTTREPSTFEDRVKAFVSEVASEYPVEYRIRDERVFITIYTGTQLQANKYSQIISILLSSGLYPENVRFISTERIEIDIIATPIEQKVVK